MFTVETQSLSIDGMFHICDGDGNRVKSYPAQNYTFDAVVHICIGWNDCLAAYWYPRKGLMDTFLATYWWKRAKAAEKKFEYYERNRKCDVYPRTPQSSKPASDSPAAASS